MEQKGGGGGRGGANSVELGDDVRLERAADLHEQRSLAQVLEVLVRLPREQELRAFQVLLYSYIYSYIYSIHYTVFVL